MRCDLLFPTPIFVEDFEGMAEENHHMLSFARAHAGAGRRKTNLGGYQSDDDFLSQPVCAGLVARLTHALGLVRRSLRIVQDLEIRGGWVNINGPGAFNARHVHPRSYLSGVYYLQGGEQSGPLVFHTPLLAKEMTDPDFTEPPVHGWDVATYPVVPGRCLIFPSWLEHSVFPNRDEQERVSISFNVTFRS
jgi:uncharacterized protein (TIGR02466 family)